MAFLTAIDRIRAVEQAASALGMLRTVYNQATRLRGMLVLYQDGTDPTFNAAFNTLFTAADRSELATMINQLGALAADWETNHPSALGL